MGLDLNSRFMGCFPVSPHLGEDSGIEAPSWLELFPTLVGKGANRPDSLGDLWQFQGLSYLVLRPRWNDPLERS